MFDFNVLCKLVRKLLHYYLSRPPRAGETDHRHHSGYDFYPLQTIQPFAVMESVLRLKLGRANDIEVVAMDLNPAVNAHIAKLHRDAATGRPYVLQLPRDTVADWPPGAVNYWEHVGDIIGAQVKPLPVPQLLQGVTLHAVVVAVAVWVSAFGVPDQP